MPQIERIVFVLGIALLAYLYGVASTKQHWLPAPLVEDAWRAANALREVWETGSGDLPPDALAWSEQTPVYQTPSAPPSPAAAGQGDGLILIAGGPFELLDFCPELGCLAWLMDRLNRAGLCGGCLV